MIFASRVKIYILYIQCKQVIEDNIIGEQYKYIPAVSMNFFL